MEIIPKKDMENFSLPLPIYKIVHIADATNRDREEFSILTGLDKNLVEQLKKYSLDKSDPELQENTTDLRRFGKGSYEDWYKKNRTPFVLLHKNTGAMAALLWFGPEDENIHMHVSAWRSYKPFRGTGIMKDFANFSIRFYQNKFPGVKFRAEIKKENTGSIGLAQYLGFKVSPDSDDISTTMIKEV